MKTVKSWLPFIVVALLIIILIRGFDIDKLTGTDTD